MSLIEVTQSRYVSATIRLESADDVVDKALNYVFAKDRVFQEYLKSSQSAKVVPSLRVRRAGPEPTAHGRAPVVGVETRREPTPRPSSLH